MGKIKIKETRHCCDTRERSSLLTEKMVERETLYHIEAVNKCARWFNKELIKRTKKHDSTKLGSYLTNYTLALKTNFVDVDFKRLSWWYIHTHEERHHLNDRCPYDVNMFDVMEMIFDGVSAGLARNGRVDNVSISSEVLQKAINNTVSLLVKQIKVTK